MLAILCPGQGAQKPSLLTPWLESSPTARERVGAWSEDLGLDLVAAGTSASAEEITDTAVAQPLITAASLLAHQELLSSLPGTPGATSPIAVAAGHSVGELAASAVAGVLSPQDALRIARERGLAMAEAAAAAPTGMSAVVGGRADEVQTAIEAAGLTAANVNGGGQVVAAGPLDALERLREEPPARARVVPLAVAGAFHTIAMEPAVSRVERALAGVTLQDPTCALLSNRDGAVVTSGRDAGARIVAQVAHPVRWDLCCERLLELGVTAAIELTPAGVLTGLAKRTLRGVEVVALSTPDDLPAARDLIARHTATDEESAR